MLWHDGTAVAAAWEARQTTAIRASEMLASVIEEWMMDYKIDNEPVAFEPEVSRGTGHFRRAEFHTYMGTLTPQQVREPVRKRARAQQAPRGVWWIWLLASPSEYGTTQHSVADGRRAVDRSVAREKRKHTLRKQITAR